MKKSALFVILLIVFLSSTIEVVAAPQEAGLQVAQKAGKATRKAAAKARVFYHGPAQFTWIAGTAVAYATNTHDEILMIDDAYYFRYIFYNRTINTFQAVWLVSASKEGPWEPGNWVPQIAGSILCDQINADPNNPYQLCTLPWEH
jgi:hypothetical protein